MTSWEEACNRCNAKTMYVITLLPTTKNNKTPNTIQKGIQLLTDRQTATSALDRKIIHYIYKMENFIRTGTHDMYRYKSPENRDSSPSNR